MDIESAEGYTLVGNLEDARNFFVIKVPRVPKNDNLSHELVVGMYGTNMLRKYIPNYLYVYGGFKCSPPLVDPETNKVATFCLHNDNAVNYMVLENISPSISMSKYVKKCSGADFINIYLQILYALKFGKERTDFTHYDLHTDNILIRDINQNVPKSEKTFQIKYYTEEGEQYIRTQVIPTIIDYGFSHIKINNDNYNNQDIGRSGYVDFSIFPDRSFIIFDLYKLLMFSFRNAVIAKNQDVINNCVKLFKFFNSSENPSNALEKQYALRYSFPYNDQTKNISIDDFARYIKNNFDTSFIKSSKFNIPVLDCSKMCLSEKATYSEIGINPDSPLTAPTDIIDFFDLYKFLQNQGRDQEKIKIASEFKYKDSIRMHINRMENLLLTIDNQRRSIKLIDVSQLPIEQLLDYNTMSIVRSMYVSIASIIDNIMTFRFYNDIGHKVAEGYQDDNALKIMNNIMDKFESKIRPGIENSKIILANNHRYLNSIQNDNLVRQSIDRDSRLRWYWGGRYLYEEIFYPVNFQNEKNI